MRKNWTTKSLGDGFVLKTLTDLKWEKAKADLEMAELKRKCDLISNQGIYYYRRKWRKIKVEKS